MKRNLLFLFPVVIIFALSCKKDKGTTTPPASNVSYMSVTAGNTWNYENTRNPSSSPVVTNYLVTSSSRDTTINSKSYHVFSRTDALWAEYYYVNGNDYYEFLRVPILDTIKTENLLLKSNLATGGNWTQTVAPVTYSGITGNLSKSDTIIETGITKTVKGITYDSVIHVRGALKVVSISPPLFTPVFSSVIDNYYAPRVGKIYSYLKVSLKVTGAFPIDQAYENKAELVSTNFQ